MREVKVSEEAKLKTIEVQQLKAEIRELRSEPSELTNRQQDTRAEQKSKPNKKVTDTGTESEVQMLRQQVQQLQHQLTVMSV